MCHPPAVVSLLCSHSLKHHLKDAPCFRESVLSRAYRWSIKIWMALFKSNLNNYIIFSQILKMCWFSVFYTHQRATHTFNYSSYYEPNGIICIIVIIIQLNTFYAYCIILISELPYVYHSFDYRRVSPNSIMCWWAWSTYVMSCWRKV